MNKKVKEFKNKYNCNKIIKISSQFNKKILLFIMKLIIIMLLWDYEYSKPWRNSLIINERKLLPKDDISLTYTT